MSLALITFSIFDENNCKACQDHLKANEYLQISPSAYIIKTTLSLDILRRELSEYFDKTDQLFISRIRDHNWISFHIGMKNRSWVEENV